MLLSAEESHHAIASLRARPGQDVVLFDGAGREALGRIDAIDRRLVHVKVTRVVERPLELFWQVTLAVAMPKQRRRGYLVEKCTELGVAAIWPISAERNVRRWSAGDPGSEHTNANQGAKWSRRAIEAAKQSGRAWVPAVAVPQTFAACADRIGEFDAASITQTRSALPSFDTFLAGRTAGSAVLVFVGPEGGWTDTEQERALCNGAVPTTLSPTILRTETAAVAVCAAAALQSASRGPRAAGTRPTDVNAT